jgi:hypothetical protein
VFYPLRPYLALSLLILTALFSGAAHADYWELSMGFNYSRSAYSGGSYSWNRRLGGSIGYNFSDSSTIEYSYQKSYERNHYEGFEDSFYDDEVSSVNFVWNVLGRTAQIQPYGKFGIGELNRKATIYDTGRTQDQELNQLTGVLGVGLKLLLTKTLAVRVEGTSYLSGAKISSWKDNFGATFGVSFYY